MTYIIKNEAIEASFTSDQLNDLDIIKTETNTFNVIHNLKSIQGQIIDVCLNSKKVELLLNNKSYTFEISDQLDQLIEKLGFDTSQDSIVKEIKAPMPGLILDISVEEGQSFSKGDQLLILEAMKMENVIKAESDGIVKKIFLKKGDTVEKNKVIIELD